MMKRWKVVCIGCPLFCWFSRFFWQCRVLLNVKSVLTITNRPLALYLAWSCFQVLHWPWIHPNMLYIWSFSFSLFKLCCITLHFSELTWRFVNEHYSGFLILSLLNLKTTKCVKLDDMKLQGDGVVIDNISLDLWRLGIQRREGNGENTKTWIKCWCSFLFLESAVCWGIIAQKFSI